MEIIFWSFIILVIFIYLGYPFILIAISLFRKNIYKKGDFYPQVSILIPAYNEEKVIAEKLKSCYNLNYPTDNLEIILILDKCTDKTKDAAFSYNGKNLKIVEQDTRSGKMAVLNKVVPEAIGEILIFTDANAIFNKEAVKNLVKCFKDERVGGVCGRLVYRKDSQDKSIEGEGLYWRYEDYIKQLESRVNSLVTANGSIYAIRKSLFSKIDVDLADDLSIPIKIASKGKKFVYEPDAVATEKPPQKAEEEFYRRIRIINQGLKATFRYLRDVFRAGNLFTFEFIFHKFLRWSVPVFLIIILGSNIFLLKFKFYWVFFILQVLFYIFSFLGYFLEKGGRRIKIFYLPFYFCLLNLAALFGFVNFLSKAQTKTWEKAETTR